MKKTVRNISLYLLLICLTLSCFTGCENNNQQQETLPPEEENVKLWWAYNTENFMQDMEYDLDRDSTLRMYGIKGDTESVQLMITPKNDVASFEFKVAKLTSDSGDMITADNFEIFAEHYVEVYNSNERGSYYGFYPDALVPFAAYRRARENTIAAGKNQGIWINLNIPVDTPAGLYKGSATLTLDKEEYQIPIEVTVYDVTMPEQVHPQSSFAIWQWQLPYGEKDNYNSSTYENYFWFLVEKRVMPLNVEESVWYNFSDFTDYAAEHLADNPAISSYGLPYRSGSDGLVSEEHIRQLLNIMIDKNIELRENGSDIDLFKKAFFYLGSIIDEPSSSTFQKVRDCDLIISTCKIELAERLNDYQDLKDSLLSIKHLVTTAYTDLLVGSDTEGGVQTWCPIFDNFHTEENRAVYAARQESTLRAKGENVWWYGCINPSSPFPSYHLDAKLITSRAIAWMQYDYNIEGNLYWCVNISQAYTGAGYVERDIWSDPLTWPGVNGEGYLVYPGEKYSLSEPISTLRLESIRESHEDYEYLWLFEQKINEYNEQTGAQLDANELLQRYFTKLYSGTIPQTDTDVFSVTRIELLQMLEKLYTDRDAAIAELTGT